MTEREYSSKEKSLLSNDYADPCPDCGAVLFEWEDSCEECAGGQEPDTEQVTLTDGGTSSVDTEHIDAEHIHVVSKSSRIAPSQSTVRYQELDNGQRIEGRGLDKNGDLQRFAHIDVSPDAAIELARQILQAHSEDA